MKFNFKSKLGFTLIELLVVIGILAVLAAIAIPSVAGLIDRANVSADATNANEMTNAIERFTSEYELYLQDIASGRLDTTNLDSAQGRVYNVTGVTDRAGIESLEKDATAGVDTTGKAIYRDTKYPVNAETMQAVVENYMKTSSTTFTPKQSDCHYYYSPDCGLVVCTETEKSDVTDLNALVQSGKDAKGKDLDSTTKWIDLTNDVSVDGGNSSPETLNHSGTIPEGATYTAKDGIQRCEICGYDFTNTPSNCSCGKYQNTVYMPNTVYNTGDNFPSTVNDGDVYMFGDYEYRYNEANHMGTWGPLNGGWGVDVIDDTKTSYGVILENINGQPVTMLCSTFWNCTKLTSAPKIPNSITNMYYAFRNCPLLTVKPNIHNSVTTVESDIFAGCSQFGY